MAIIIQTYGGFEIFWPKASPKIQPHNTFMVPWQYWLCIVKPKRLQCDLKQFQ